MRGPGCLVSFRRKRTIDLPPAVKLFAAFQEALAQLVREDGLEGTEEDPRLPTRDAPR